MGKIVKVVGWFFGILIFLFGLLIFGNTLLSLGDAATPILGGLLIMLIGALASYRASRSGRKKDVTYHGVNRSSATNNLEEMQEEKIEWEIDLEKERSKIMEPAMKDWNTKQN